MAASLNDILTEFWDLDQEVTDPYVLGQLAQLCQRYNIGAENISCEYYTFRNNTKNRINGKLIRGPPTLETLVPFENEWLKTLKPVFIHSEDLDEILVALEDTKRAATDAKLYPHLRRTGYVGALEDKLEDLVEILADIEAKKKLATGVKEVRILAQQRETPVKEAQELSAFGKNGSLELREDGEAHVERNSYTEAPIMALEEQLKEHLELKENSRAMLEENRDMKEKIKVFEEQLKEHMELKENSKAKLKENRDMKERIKALEGQLKESLEMNEESKAFAKRKQNEYNDA